MPLQIHQNIWLPYFWRFRLAARSTSDSISLQIPRKIRSFRATSAITSWVSNKPLSTLGFAWLRLASGSKKPSSLAQDKSPTWRVLKRIRVAKKGVQIGTRIHHVLPSTCWFQLFYHFPKRRGYSLVFNGWMKTHPLVNYVPAQNRKMSLANGRLIIILQEYGGDSG